MNNTQRDKIVIGKGMGFEGIRAKWAEERDHVKHKTEEK